jgi:hypothetical protein
MPQMLRNFSKMKFRYDPYLQSLTLEAVPGCSHIEVAVVCIAAQHLRCNYTDRKFADLNLCLDQANLPQILQFAICDLRFAEGTSHKFADLQLRNELNTCGFVICGLTKEICVPTLWFFRERFLTRVILCCGSFLSPSKTGNFM